MQIIQEFNCENMIIEGDLNLAMNQEIDKKKRCL